MHQVCRLQHHHSPSPNAHHVRRQVDPLRHPVVIIARLGSQHPSAINKSPNTEIGSRHHELHRVCNTSLENRTHTTRPTRTIYARHRGESSHVFSQMIVRGILYDSNLNTLATFLFSFFLLHLLSFSLTFLLSSWTRYPTSSQSMMKSELSMISHRAPTLPYPTLSCLIEAKARRIM